MIYPDEMRDPAMQMMEDKRTCLGCLLWLGLFIAILVGGIIVFVK